MINDRITGCVTAFNAEQSIGGCLDSLRICDEVIVVDCGSTDRTRDVAAAHGARVIECGWTDSRLRKWLAVRQASNDWIIFVTPDERVSASLTSEILRVRPYGLGGYAGYQMPYVGCEKRSGYSLRLFDRRRSQWRGKGTDERVVAYGPVGTLRGHVLSGA